jgi:hypothetical protein
MQTDFDDLRFTSSNGTTSLQFWREDTIVSGTTTVWVKVPSLPANSSATYIFVYYGNGSATAADSGSGTFSFIEDFEDADITDYSGTVTEKGYYTASSTGFHNGAYGLSASAGNETQRTQNGGIYKTGSQTAQGKTIRYFQYVNASSGAGSDGPCTLFAVQGSGQNYGVCLQQFGGNYVGISKNVSSNATADGATSLNTTAVTWTSGWYEVVIDWLTTNAINVKVYDSSGTLFASVSTTDSTYTSAGGMGFTFWVQHGSWDTYMVKPYTATTPTTVLGEEQGRSGATWKVAEDTILTGQLPNTNVRLRFSVQNTGSNQTNQQYRLQIAEKGGSLSCEAVPYVNYSDVPTTTGGCGSAPACMTTSAQFTDQTNTAGLLTYPAYMYFTFGKILEDPSNQNTALNLNANTATEVEYNFQITNNATQGTYCFRTSNAGADLANYDRVAEITVIHPPFITNLNLNNGQSIALTEGATTTIYATSTVTDYNGYSDISSASSTIYRSSLGSSCTANDNNCYKISSSSCTLSNCSGNSCTLSCRADIQYFADPTDTGTYSAEKWESHVQVYDTSGYSDHETSLGVELLTLYALSIETPGIDFGSLYVGTDTGAFDATTTIANTGNAQIDIDILGTDLVGGVDTIPVGQQKYATSTFVYSSCTICQFLTGSATNFNVNIPKPTSTSTPSSDEIYWGISIPTGIGATTYSGTNTFIAVGG